MISHHDSLALIVRHVTFFSKQLKQFDMKLCPPMDFVTHLGDDWQFDAETLTWPVFCDFYIPGGLWSLLGLRSHRCRFLDMWTLREEREHRHFVWMIAMFGDTHNKGSFDFSPELELIIGCFLPIPFFSSLPSFFIQRRFPCLLMQHPSKPSWHPQPVCTQWYSPTITGQLCAWNSVSFGSILSEAEVVLCVESLEKTFCSLE